MENPNITFLIYKTVTAMVFIFLNKIKIYRNIVLKSAVHKYCSICLLNAVYNTENHNKPPYTAFMLSCVRLYLIFVTSELVIKVVLYSVFICIHIFIAFIIHFISPQILSIKPNLNSYLSIIYFK